MTQLVDGSVETTSHQVDRLAIRIDDSFDGFRHRYEQAVPVFQRARFDSFVERGVDWQTVLEATAENAPHDFILYWSHDFTSLMRLAGDRGCSTLPYAQPSWKTPTAPRGSPWTNPAPGSAVSTHPKSPR